MLYQSQDEYIFQKIKYLLGSNVNKSESIALSYERMLTYETSST